MRAYFTSPKMEQAESLDVYLVHVMGRLVLVAAAVGLLLIFITAPASLWGIYLILVLGLIGLGLWVLGLNRSGHTRLASMILVLSIWVVVTVSSTVGGGVQSGSYIGYVGVAILAALLLGGRMSTLLVVFSVALGLWMAIGVERGWLAPPSTHSPVASWMISTLLLTVIAFLQSMGSKTILQAMKRAQSSEADYRTLFEEAPDGICLIGSDFRVALANPALCSMLGYSLEELRGKDPATFVAPEDRAARPVRSPDALRQPGPLKRERVLVRNDGSRLDAILTSRYMPDGRFQFIVQDITERKKAEAALRDSETRFRTLVENLPDVVTRHDRDLRYLYVSPMMGSLSGRPPAELLGHTVREVDLPQGLAEATVRALDMAVATGQTTEFEISFEMESQSISYESRAVPEFDADGRVQSVLTVYHNTTNRRLAEAALRESENRHRSLLENIPAITYISNVGPERRNLYVSPQVEGLLGYGQEDFVADPALWMRIIHPADLDGVRAENASSDLTGRRFKSDYRLLTRQGEVMWVRDEAVLVRGEGGQPDYWLGVWSNITELKQGEEQILQREAILNAVAYAAEKFLRLSDWGANIQAVLEELGRKIGASHAYLFENHVSPEGLPVSSMRFEWAAPNMQSDLDSPVYQNVPLVEPGFERWAEQLGRGEPFFGNLNSLPESEARSLAERGMKSLLDMPIMVGSTWWGVIGFDDMEAEREWSKAEVDALNVAANIIGAAIQRERAEEALRQSEELYRRAIEAAGAVPYFRDHIRNAYSWMGHGIRQMTGYGPDEMTPQLLDSLLEEQVPMGEGAAYSAAEATRRARSGLLTVWQCDYKIQRRDGEYRWLADSSVEILTEAGHSRGSIGILQDITERKAAFEEVQRLNAELEQRVAQRTEALRASEARFRAMNDASPLGVYVDDPNGNRVYCNAIYQAITGLTAEDALGAGWKKAIHPADLDSVSAGWANALERRPFVYEQVYQVVRPSGRGVWVNAKASEMRDGDQLLGYVGTLEDITARVNSEESLRRRTAQLEAANRELEAFSYSVSHDLRAPLRAVDGFARLLLQDYADSLDSDGLRYLHKVRDSAQHMGHLIDDLLAFSRLGRHALKRQHLATPELKTLVRRVVADVVGEQPERKFEITIGDLPACDADVNLLTQVFVNLLSNAVKFTRPRDITQIEVGGDWAARGPRYFVRDNGVGFDMQYHDKVFGVFQRLHRMEEFEGTGVGLAIVQRIIQRHGGRVWAETVPGQGATFFFTIGRPGEETA